MKTGKTRVPYKMLKDGLVEVRGLPDGFLFKKPSACSKWELEIIKEHMDDISFVGRFFEKKN